MIVPPIVDPDTLAAYLKGTPDPGLVELCAAAASDAIGAVVDPAPVDDTGEVPDGWGWPAGVSLSGLGVAADAFKSLSAPGGGYALDELTYTDAFRVVSTLVRRYEPFYNPARAVAGMVG